MNRVKVVLGLLFLVSVLSYAMPKNQNVALKEIRSKYKSLKTFKCEFTEQFQWQMTGEQVERKGEIVIGSENRFKVTTPEQVMVSDGVNLYRHNLSRKQVMIESIGNAQNLLPRKLLLDFTSDFDATEMSPIAVSGKAGFRLDLKPQKPEESLISTASIWVSDEDFIVHRMRFEDMNRNFTTYSLQNIVFDAAVPDSATIFTTPENVEIFDLRK
jgi:outer membrane lipoprotein-sorting protein